MFNHKRISILAALVAAMIFAVPVFAGGWAVITLDELPAGAVAGEPLTVGFTVRQHGMTPMTGLSPSVTAILGEEKLVFPAEAEGEPGHYTATLTFPNEGEWTWAIDAFSMYQPMPALSVAAAGALATNPAVNETASTSLLLDSIVPLSLAILGLGLLGAVVGIRRRSRPVLLLTSVCLLAGIALLVVGAGPASDAEAQTKSEFSSHASVSQVEYGRQLFLAKGCITCHANSKATRSAQYMTIEMGAPNLSTFSANPEIIFMRLKDPASVKSDTKMPQLGLKEEEIEALVAFINSK